MASRLPEDGPRRVLVLVEQQTVAEVVKLTLNHGVYVTREVANPADAAILLKAWDPHLALIEVELDDGRLLQEMEQERNGRQRVPVLALTRRGDLKAKLAAFDSGADDIIAVPFSPEELLARVLVMTRRRYGESAVLTPVLHVGGLEIDILNRRVRMGETVIHLSGVEQSLLYLLAANPGTLLSNDDIMDAVWGMDFVADSTIVDLHIRSLRVKLEQGWPRPRFITTLPGGYCFIPAPSEAGRTS